jgi:hypothetical protein
MYNILTGQCVNKTCPALIVLNNSPLNRMVIKMRDNHPLPGTTHVMEVLQKRRHELASGAWLFAHWR